MGGTHICLICRRANTADRVGELYASFGGSAILVIAGIDELYDVFPSENLFLCLLRISFYPCISFAIEKYTALRYNIAVQLLIPYMMCRCKRHFIEKRSSRPLFIGAHGIAKIKV